ncbi:hypothetical protein D1007_22944 [Hordeum vulgare]|nr:hypothetical protein D1007_22944 [Hordeum vulgare]
MGPLHRDIIGNYLDNGYKNMFETMVTINIISSRGLVAIMSMFVNIPDYRFTTVDTTNDLKVLKTSGFSYQKLVNIQGEYRVWGSMKKKQKDSLVDLTVAIIDPYYGDMKVE